MSKTKVILLALLSLSLFVILKYTPVKNWYSVSPSMQYTQYNPQSENVIVMLHGVPTSETLYGPLSKELVDDYRIIIPHLYGKHFGYNPRDDASALIDLLNELTIQSATFIVHDRGGVVLWELLDQKPELAERLLILNTIADEFDAPFPQNILGKLMVYSLYNQYGSGANMVKQTLSMGGIDNQVIRENITDDISLAGYSHLRHFFTHFDSLSSQIGTYQKTMNNYDGSIHVIWGMEDEFLDSEKHLNALRNYFNLTDEQITELPNQKHYVPVTAITAIVEILNK